MGKSGRSVKGAQASALHVCIFHRPRKEGEADEIKQTRKCLSVEGL